ncbi:MAG: hypothetical protein Kow0056_08620 [Coriobacteriia bacterium]
MKYRPGASSRDEGRQAYAVTALVAGILVAIKTAVAVHVGPGWDSFAFLANAAEFAGKSVGYVELHRPPFLSLVTAVPIALGYVKASAIQYVDAAFSFGAVLAFFALLRRRFAPLPSAIGAIALLTVPPLWSYIGVGYTDFASVGITLLGLLLCIKATEESSWWYLGAAALFVIGVLTRYTALLAAFPFAVYVFLRWEPFRQAKSLVQAVLVAIITYVPAGWFYVTRYGDALFPFIVAANITQDVSAPSTEGAAAGGAWYLQNALTLLAPESLSVFTAIVVAVAASGLAVGVWRSLRETRPDAARILAGLAVIAIPVGVQLANAGLFVRQLSIPIAVFFVWRLLAPRETRGHRSLTTAESALDAAILTWLLVYLDFHGHQNLQVPRYVIPMAPALLYLLLLGWRTWQLSTSAPGILTAGHAAPSRSSRSPDEASAGKPARISNHFSTAAWLPLVLIVAIGVGVTVANTPRKPDKLVRAAQQTAEWLKRESPDATSSVVYSDLWPLTSWYLGAQARAMPFFEEDEAFQHELDKYDARYFVTIRTRRFTGFDEVYSYEGVAVLERTAPAPSKKPRVQYLGHAWQNYLEPLTDYSFYLLSSSGRFGWEGSAFADALTADDLQGMDAVAFYSARWKDRGMVESNLREYIESGGVLIVDASANLGGSWSSLRDTVFLDTVIRSGTIARTPSIEVSADFAADHPEVANVTPSPFSDDAGNEWRGAEYVALDPANPHEVLVSADGKPLVSVQRMGRGRVYWIAYNLFWHAFMTHNTSEERLVRAIFDDALGVTQ